jgi:putative Holliday junction resolvase
VSTERTRLLGVDYGTVRIGLAVSDAERIIASPLATYRRRSRDEDAEYFRKLVAEEAIGTIVVGLPAHLSGAEGQKAAEARQFGQWLAETTQLPLIFWDESLSTVQAESALWDAGLSHKRRRERRDRVAAQVMLRAYMEAHS